MSLYRHLPLSGIPVDALLIEFTSKKAAKQFYAFARKFSQVRNVQHPLHHNGKGERIITQVLVTYQSPADPKDFQFVDQLKDKATELGGGVLP